MYDNATCAALLLVFCSMPLTVLSTRGSAQSSTPDTPRAELPLPALGSHAPATKEQKMASCMALWEAETHMTRTEWKNVCKRIESRN
ncbi:hypothetical protein [Hyphomicrobium sp. DMF-1]|uniref:hypothetical protein n=1 Tax=Hyphomicrobium sp. DMF-1 TaxID=3019544 RepID=UPI0022EBD3A6|nr:hypothetical protein [Hyphomicrobium sp. DMF-1]WBT37677.1 hypothetical protein PE058_18750 [Hyphomicrobium sp. DMF-1]